MAWKSFGKGWGRVRAIGLLVAVGLTVCSAAVAEGKGTKYSGSTTPYGGKVSFTVNSGKIASFSFTAPDCLKQHVFTKNYQSRPIPAFTFTGSSFSHELMVTYSSGPAGSKTAKYTIKGKFKKHNGKQEASGTIGIFYKELTMIGPFSFGSSCSITPTVHFKAAAK